MVSTVPRIRGIALGLAILIAACTKHEPDVSAVAGAGGAGGVPTSVTVPDEQFNDTTTAQGGAGGAGTAAGAAGAAGVISNAAGSGGNQGAVGGAGTAGQSVGGADASGGGAGGNAGVPATVPCAVDPEQIFDDIAYLASDELRGRLPGDIGNQLAVEFAEQAFITAGLVPGGDDDTYRQSFPYSDGDNAGITDNVLGKLVGADPVLSSEVIIVGAHIDHLGVNEDGSINYGADDNASGTAIVMELARMFQRCNVAPKRTLVFVAWNAEEMGLIGSRYYVDNPILPLDDTIAAYNFDMVGGGDGTGVLLFGGDDDANRWLTDLMINAADAEQLPHTIELVPQKLASDHAPFVQRGIPICWGFSRPDPHPGYHTPGDDMGKIKVQSLRAVSELFWAALRPLSLGEEGTFVGADAALRRSASLRQRSLVIGPQHVDSLSGERGEDGLVEGLCAH